MCHREMLTLSPVCSVRPTLVRAQRLSLDAHSWRFVFYGVYFQRHFFWHTRSKASSRCATGMSQVAVKIEKPSRLPGLWEDLGFIKSSLHQVRQDRHTFHTNHWLLEPEGGKSHEGTDWRVCRRADQVKSREFRLSAWLWDVAQAALTCACVNTSARFGPSVRERPVRGCEAVRLPSSRHSGL